jgi:hypothetical protein
MHDPLPADSDASPYNTAHLVDDRSRLYAAYDVDRALDDGGSGPTDEPPGDYHERRAAVLAFYGRRCGRCATDLARSAPESGVSLGYLSPVDDGAPRWALASLVAVCEPCDDLLTATEPADLERVGDAHERAPQFPAWHCDPRVAVERAPLTGREAWLCERLRARVDAREDRGVNAPARDACLASDAGAATAVALGEALAADETRLPDEGRLRDVWSDLPGRVRDRYAAAAVDLDAFAESAAEAETPAERVAAIEGGVVRETAAPVATADAGVDADPDAGGTVFDLE